MNEMRDYEGDLNKTERAADTAVRADGEGYESRAILDQIGLRAPTLGDPFVWALEIALICCGCALVQRSCYVMFGKARGLPTAEDSVTRYFDHAVSWDKGFADLDALGRTDSFTAVGD
jgi:hypothetical protein